MEQLRAELSHLLGEKLDGNRGGANGDGHTVLVEVIHLHGLPAACARGDVGVVKTDQRNIQRRRQRFKEPYLRNRNKNQERFRC